MSRDTACTFADTPNVVTSPGAAKHRGVAERVRRCLRKAKESKGSPAAPLEEAMELKHCHKCGCQMRYCSVKLDYL